MVFRDPAKFIEMLTDKGGAEGAAATEGSEFSTQLAPETKAREAQVLTVKKVRVCGHIMEAAGAAAADYYGSEEAVSEAERNVAEAGL